MRISAIMPILNGVTCGYPFLEAILSVLPICDEFLIEDGGSEDQTLEFLKRLKKVFPKKIFLFRANWKKGNCWEPIDKAVESLISKAKGDWIFEVQGDEIWHENDIFKLKKVIEYANEHFFNSLRQPRIDIEAGWKKQEYVYRTVRIVRKIKNLKSYWGGDDFQIGEHKGVRKGFTSHNVLPELETSIPFYHLHRVFPENAKLADETIANFLAPKDKERQIFFEYSHSFSNSNLEFLPTIVKGLVGKKRYEVRKEIFDKKWLKKITKINYDVF